MASPEAWRQDPGLVLDFYNERRQAVREAKPNTAHLALVELERAYDVWIVTQNVDDLHERAGSSRMLHLHGEIRQARSTNDPPLVTHPALRAGAALRDPRRRRPRDQSPLRAPPTQGGQLGRAGSLANVHAAWGQWRRRPLAF